MISFFQDEKRQILKMSGWLTVVGIKVYHCYQYMLKKTSKAVTINWYENKRLYPDMPGKGFSQFTQEEQIIKIKMDVFLQLTSTDYVKVIFDTGGFMFNKEVPNILLFLLLFFFVVFFFLCVFFFCFVCLLFCCCFFYNLKKVERYCFISLSHKFKMLFSLKTIQNIGYPLYNMLGLSRNGWMSFCSGHRPSLVDYLQL